jgi:Carboxypeptidase regulatory-like domain/TonB dependent receptor
MPRSPEVCTCVFCPQGKSRFGESTRAISARFVQFIAFVLLMCSALIVVQAQSPTATLSGIVRDPAGASIPNVNISVISIAQGFQRSTTTNEQGTFVVSLLPPGSYIVKAECKGFSPTEFRDITLNVSDERTIQLYLKVGEISQTVQIIEGATLLNESPTVGTVIDREFVSKIPVQGRSFQSLITLTPGTVLTTTNATEFGQFSVNGQRADANYSMIDGVSGNVSPTYATGGAFSQNNSGSVLGFSALGTTSNIVSIDALQEFKVLTSSFAPEFGRTPGGQISIVTRSGGNDFHGSLFEYFRNDALDANDWFANNLGRKRTALRQNIFGGTLGGPVLLPRFGEGGKQPWYDGHDRSFFFFSYEGQRLLLPKFTVIDVPSLQARASATQPAIQQLLNAFPVPTGLAKANRFADFAAAYSDPSNLDSTSIRVDHVVSPRLLLFARYNYSPSVSITRGNGNSLNVLNTITNKTQTLTFGVTSPLTATVSNEFRGNWSRVRGAQSFDLDEFGGAIIPPRSFFLLPEFTTPRSGGIITLSSPLSVQLRVGTLADNLQRQLNFVENFSIANGPHQFKFGVDYRRLTPLVGSNDYLPQLSFSGINGALTGRTSSAFIVVFTGGLEPVYNNFSGYAQDTWRINKRAVLTYGVRWDLNPAPYEKNGNDPAVVDQIDNVSTMTLAPFGSPLYKTTYNNFAPRVGIAYRLSQNPGRETILRGGFGIFYDLGNQTTGGAFANAFPFSTNRRVLPNPVFPLTHDQSVRPVLTRNLPATTALFAYDPNLKLPRTYQWNFAVEQSLGSHQTLSATYVGTMGRKLLRQQTTGGDALLNPNFSVVMITRNTAASDYHALQVQFQRRLSRGLQVVAFYSWAHSIDIASRDSATNDSFPVAGLDPNTDRGSSDFDLRHAFRMATTYQLPKIGRSTFARAVLHDWSINGIFTAQSAPPVDVTYTLSGAFNAITILGARPDLIPGVPLYVDDPLAPGGRRINRAAFSIPTTQRPGSLGRNSLSGFPLSQLDFSLRRDFRLSERGTLSFAAEFFNLLNHPNFAKPSSSLGTNDFGDFIVNTNFGRSLNMLGRGLGGSQTSGLNALYQIGGPRSTQLSLRLEY